MKARYFKEREKFSFQRRYRKPGYPCGSSPNADRRQQLQWCSFTYAHAERPPAGTAQKAVSIILLIAIWKISQTPEMSSIPHGTGYLRNADPQAHHKSISILEAPHQLLILLLIQTAQLPPKHLLLETYIIGSLQLHSFLRWSPSAPLYVLFSLFTKGEYVSSILQGALAESNMYV